MRGRAHLTVLVASLLLCLAADGLACGDKFLVTSRGTRYERPKSVRAASVLIYADPTAGLTGVLGDVPVEAVLQREGHRSTTVASLDQLADMLTSGRFDVIVVAGSVVARVQEIVGASLQAPVVLALSLRSAGGDDPTPAVNVLQATLKSPAKEGAILEAVDKAVVLRDQNSRKIGDTQG